MCGILAIVNKKVNNNSGDLINACSIIRHRGPDDEGLLTWAPGSQPTVWAGGDTAESTLSHWKYNRLEAGQPYKVGFGHRRLSILDLSPAGHQPMAHSAAGLVICFNGEVYNYLEIKKDLEAMGNHQFVTGTDTEVILHAWDQWGPKCLDRFNGMFAFIMLDYRRNELFVVRDRFGVKPLFVYDGPDSLYFASELKQIKTNPGFTNNVNETRLRQYLATGAINHTNETFQKNIQSLPGGHYLHIKDLNKEGAAYEVVQWYQLKPKPFTGAYTDATKQLRELLIDAVRIRLRSDVTVGSCLSGGLDSSSIVCIAADILKEGGASEGQETVTACYEAARFDEWKFALEVIEQTKAHPHRTFPSFTQLENEVEQFFFHQDDPTGSTSQFSQWAVFKATQEAGLKVMIDGQGADEQLAGYGGNDLSFYSGLFSNGQIGDLIEEAKTYKAANGHWPVGFLLGGLDNSGNALAGLLPAKWKVKPVQPVSWMTGEEPSSIYTRPAKSLNENLLRQLYGEPLPALLRYEDHSSMAWSVESRTPFMDYRLVEFTMGLPARFVYKNGVRKTI
ncbi:MAG: asparagine synthase (glutamine-hydrolyzing), partial [Chitinophagia bacterium]|nr:asparagine synthase (glutamine-hydrolyzing) [Chitinophagia bacterium]